MITLCVVKTTRRALVLFRALSTAKGTTKGTTKALPELLGAYASQRAGAAASFGSRPHHKHYEAFKSFRRQRKCPFSRTPRHRHMPKRHAEVDEVHKPRLRKASSRREAPVLRRSWKYQLDSEECWQRKLHVDKLWAGSYRW